MQKNRPKIGCGGTSLLPKLFRGFGPNHWKLRAGDPKDCNVPSRPSDPHWFLWNWHLKLHSHSPLLFIIMRVMMFIDLIYFNRLKTDPLISTVCLVCLSIKTKARCYPGRETSFCICTWNSNSYWRQGWHSTWYRGQGPSHEEDIYTPPCKLLTSEDKSTHKLQVTSLFPHTTRGW